MRHQIKEELRGVLLFVAMIWGVFALDLILPAVLTQWGIRPRTAWGLVGIPLAPFLHGGIGHLLSNTVPLVVLLILLAGSRIRTWETVCEIVLGGGALLWLFGRGDSVHVGASGLVYGLIAFLIVSGFRERRPIPLLIAILVGFLYGGTLISGVLPTVGSGISWDGHLTSAIAGGLIGYFGTSSSGDEASKSELPLKSPGSS